MHSLDATCWIHTTSFWQHLPTAWFHSGQPCPTPFLASSQERWATAAAAPPSSSSPFLNNAPLEGAIMPVACECHCFLFFWRGAQFLVLNLRRALRRKKILVATCTKVARNAMQANGGRMVMGNSHSLAGVLYPNIIGHGPVANGHLWPWMEGCKISPCAFICLVLTEPYS